MYEVKSTPLMKIITMKGARLLTMLLGIVLLGATTSLAQVPVSIDDLNVRAGETVTVPVEVGDLTNEDVFSFDFALSYDASLIDSVTASQAGLSDGSNVLFEQNEPSSGELRVAVSSGGSDPLSGQGRLAELQIAVKSDVQGASPLEFESFQFNEGMPAATTSDGSVTVADVFVSLPDVTQRAGTTVTFDIETGDLTGLGVQAYDFDLPFDGSVLSNIQVIQSGTLSEGVDIQSNVENNTLSVAANAGTDSIEGEGALLTIEADLSAGSSALEFDSFQYNEGDPSVGLLGGSVRSADVIVSLPDMQAAVGSEQTIFISSTDLTGEEASTYEFVFAYDSSSLTVYEDSIVTEGTNTGDRLVEANVTDSTVAIATQGNTEFLEGEGQLVGIEATILRAGKSDLSFTKVQFNEGDPSAVGTDGSITAVENRPPDITDVPSGSTQPLQTFTGQVVASDPDDDPLTYSLTGDPDNASIDDTGGFEFTPPFSQRDSDVSFTVEVSDGTATVDSSFVITVEPLDRSPISVNINQSFGDATVQSNYRLVGLPGQVDLGIGQTVQGESGASNDWRAFWDDGSSSTQAGLIEFDGSSRFNFRPGRGFWLLSRNAWSVSATYDPVPLDNTANASIPLHEGWNIISNPLGKDVSWTTVQSENGISTALHSFSAGFSMTSNFASAQEGEAFYFLNNEGLSELLIPFFANGSSTQESKSDDHDAAMLTLETRVQEETTSSVVLGMRSDAKRGEDEFDHFAPPNYFERAALRADNEEIESEYMLASDVRPSDSKGHTYDLSLEANAGSKVTITAKGFGSFRRNQEIRLFDAGAARSYDLRTNRTVVLQLDTDTRELVVMIGSESYVESKQSELVPKQVRLHQNYPNPFRTQTTLRFALPKEVDVRLDVYDLLGRRVQTLVDGRMTAGVHTLQWNGDARNGQELASGTYLVRLHAGDQMRTMKMVLVK